MAVLIRADGAERTARYLRAISTGVGCGFNVPENCEAITNAATIAGRQISLTNWSTESIAIVPTISRPKAA